VAGDTRTMTVAGRGIGIDVGASSVKVAVVRRQLRGLALERVVEQPIARSGAGRAAPEAVAEAVAAAMADVRVGRAVVVAGVPTQLTTVRNLDVPFSDEARIRQVVKTEVEPHLPFAAEEIVVDYCPTGIERETPAVAEDETPPPVPTNLLITAAQKKVVGDVLAATSSEQVDPEVVDVEFMGAFSAVRTLAPETIEGGELVIDVGASKTTVIYARKGRPLAVRAINVGGDALTQAVADAAGRSFVEAEAEKASLTVPREGEQGAPAERALAESLGGLRRGLDQTLRFFASQVGDVGYDRVVLTGGSASLRGLDAWFGGVLGTAVMRLESLGPVGNATRQELVVAPFATAIGLALRGVGESVSQHNFRQEELGYPNPLKRLVKYLAPAVGLIIAIVLAWMAAHFIAYSITRAEADAYTRAKERELRRVLGRSGGRVDFDQAKDRYEERLAELNVLRDENPQSVLEVWAEISRICYGEHPLDDTVTLPTDPEAARNLFIDRSSPWLVQITTFHMEGGRVEIVGSAAGFIAYNNLRKALAASPLFAKVIDKGSRPVSGGRTEFKLWLELEQQQQVQ
jgi:type IV pilus assembly protein PilM